MSRTVRVLIGSNTNSNAGAPLVGSPAYYSLTFYYHVDHWTALTGREPDGSPLNVDADLSCLRYMAHIEMYPLLSVPSDIVVAKRQKTA